MTTRHPGGHHGLTLPGPMPWLGRGGQHPLAGPLATATLAPAPSFQPTYMPTQSVRPAAHMRPTVAALPHFASSQLSVPVYGAMRPAQAAPCAVAGHQPAASLRPVLASQVVASQTQGFHWSQRSQLEDIVVGTQLLPEEEEEQGVGDNAATVEVGSAPAAGDLYGGDIGPSQPEVTRPPRPAAPTQTAGMAARLLVDQFKSNHLNVSQLDDQPVLDGLTSKLKEMSGKQSAQEEVLDKMKVDLAAHTAALEGIGTICKQLLQAVQSLDGASNGMAARLEQLLAKPPAAITGDMATQTSPQLAAPAQPGGSAPSPAQPPAGILQTFCQRRPSSAAGLPAFPPAAAALLPTRGLSAGATTAAAAAAKPSITPTTSPGSAAVAAAAAAAPPMNEKACKRQWVPVAAAAMQAPPGSTDKGTCKPGSAAKRRQPKHTSQRAEAAKHTPAVSLQGAAAKLAPAPAAKPQGSFSRKRPLDTSSQQMKQQQLRLNKQQRPTAEALFDALFDDEQENFAAAVAPQAQLLAKQDVAAAVAAANNSRGQQDLAAKVRARLEKHRARFARRRTASQRQLEGEE